MKMKLFVQFQLILCFYLLLCVISRTVLVTAADPALVSQFLGGQNQARAQVGDPPLVWDDTLASYAEAYANQRKGDCALQHSNGPYGENIFWGGGSSWQPKDANAAWISESSVFNHGTHMCDQIQKCGHYSQIVWKNSVRVGCARVICNNGDTFMTCNYDPPGNVIGQKAY